MIWERLVTEHGFTGHYQRVKVYVREHRARLATASPEPAELPLDPLGDRLDPVKKAALERGWLDAGKHAGKRIV